MGGSARRTEKQLLKNHVANQKVIGRVEEVKQGLGADTITWSEVVFAA